ncbi:putative monovalent cation/H+ antiporter subunit B [Oxobacter pfennigii]|uniref:Putative monovalent cation/H+ antiporter subunit B n=1 Tax=Oxobacter pfennigii TaxID=36849 RepID=A0A0P8W4B3_9CLOT|nr:hydrogen gas-evolving membrane-bound hydrogenase subunit E [Oxobacter pfennigii]KPU42303.1 putative monovalent cation/H+ antiporter subunit B [Oxobacter pfennigii]
MKRIIAIITAFILICILLTGIYELPSFGNKDNPSNNETMKYYIENVVLDTGAINIVTGIILDYRAFDTFVEASVLFTSASIVIMLLKGGSKGYFKDAEFKGIILKEISAIVIPLIQIFGLYVIFFGHLGPGGGFSGGTILGASLILIQLAFKKDKINDKAYNVFLRLLSGAAILYGVMKGYSFIAGGSHLPWWKPSLGTPGDILSGGYILPLNIIVGIIVSITMYFFYMLFDRGDV